jgi:hypothetical protein
MDRLTLDKDKIKVYKHPHLLQVAARSPTCTMFNKMVYVVGGCTGNKQHLDTTQIIEETGVKLTAIELQ